MTAPGTFPQRSLRGRASGYARARPEPLACLQCGEPCQPYDFIDALGDCLCARCLEDMIPQGETP